MECLCFSFHFVVCMHSTNMYKTLPETQGLGIESETWGHYDCNVLRFSIVGISENITFLHFPLQFTATQKGHTGYGQHTSYPLLRRCPRHCHYLDRNLLPYFLLHLTFEFSDQFGCLEFWPFVHLLFKPFPQIFLCQANVGPQLDFTDPDLTLSRIELINLPTMGFPFHSTLQSEFDQYLVVLIHQSQILYRKVDFDFHVLSLTGFRLTDGWT